MFGLGGVQVGFFRYDDEESAVSRFNYTLYVVVQLPIMHCKHTRIFTLFAVTTLQVHSH